jgi:antitoxin VapB
MLLAKRVRQKVSFGVGEARDRPAMLAVPGRQIYIAIYTLPLELAMSQTRTAKLFKNGASQAVRLPAEFRFEGKEVYATRDEQTGDVVLSTRPGARTWAEFFALMRTIEVPDDFMAVRPMNLPPRERDPFEESK